MQIDGTRSSDLSRRSSVFGRRQVHVAIRNIGEEIAAGSRDVTLSRVISWSLGPVLLVLSGCAYRLPPFTPPSQERIRIIARAPEEYVLKADFGEITSYEVPHDGRVLAGVPPYRTCGVYLFNVVRVKAENEPLKNWSMSVLHNGKVLRSLSLIQLRKLPSDDAGYHILRMPT